MRKTLVAIFLFSFCFFVRSYAQQGGASTSRRQNGSAPFFERKIRQAWEDYKNKQKAALAGILADDVIEVEEDGNGARDKKAELLEMDEINLAEYALSDFHFRPIGSGGMLVRYNVEYTAKPAGQTIHNKSAIGEVWEKKTGNWKLAYLQETKIN